MRGTYGRRVRPGGLRSVALVLMIVACDDGRRESTAPTAPARPQVSAGDASGDASAGRLGPNMTSLSGVADLPLPYTANVSIAQTLFSITNSLNGGVARFENTGATTNAIATLFARSNGSGPTLQVQHLGGDNNTVSISNISSGSGLVVSAVDSITLRSSSGGSGRAGRFTSNANTTGSTLVAEHSGGYTAFEARSSGANAVAGLFLQTGTTSPWSALAVSSAGTGSAQQISQSGTGQGINVFLSNANNPNSAVVATTSGSGWAGQFTGQGPSSRGVIVTTQGGAGLQVVGGSKNAVVGTSSGARALYTEESSEVWFTDYGFGRLRGDRVHVTLDPMFLETVANGEPYHVFVQAYGRSDLYVSGRTATGFDVALRDGSRDIEFSYRIVAKRRGFEHARLERAPWADEAVQKVWRK